MRINYTALTKVAFGLSKAVPTRPNVLFVLFDSLSRSALASQIEQLPTLRSLHERAVVFDRAFASSPESTPARASVLTGLDSAAHGVWTDGVALPERETPISLQFATHGYHTWQVGRRQLAGLSHFTTEHARRGEFHAQDWAHGPLHRSRQNSYLSWLQSTAAETYAGLFPVQPDPDDTFISDEQHAAMAALPDELSFNGWAGHCATNQIAQAPTDRPFFGLLGLVVGNDMGGDPRAAAPGEGLQVSALQQADAALARALAALDANGLRDNTVVVVTAGRGNLVRGGSCMHDDHLNVPLLLEIPKHTSSRVNKPVPSLDVVATLYELSGVPAPERLQAVSLLSCLPRGWVVSRYRGTTAAHQSVYRTARWKLIATHGCGETPACLQLFDLDADPDESTDLAQCAAHQETLEELLDQMIDAKVAFEDRTAARVASF